MSLRFPVVGAVHYNQWVAASTQATCDALKGFLQTCGWTDDPWPATGDIYFTAQPADGNTYAINGKTYTFRNTIGAPANEVLIGANKEATAENLRLALTATTGSGVNFSAATTANGVTGRMRTELWWWPYANSTIRLINTNTGFTSVQFVFGNATAYISILTGHSIPFKMSSIRGHKLISPATPEGLRSACFLLDANNAGEATTYGAALVAVGSPDETVFSWWSGGGVQNITNNAGRTLEFCGNAHQWMCFLLTDSATGGCTVFVTCPALHAANAPQVINAATNASPIVITTASAHGYTTGQDVFIADAKGNTAANGFWTITVLTSTTFQLNGSTGNGAYNTTDKGVVGNYRQIARMIHIHGDQAYNQGGTWGSFRSKLSAGNADGSASAWSTVNQFWYGQSSAGDGIELIDVLFPKGRSSNAVPITYGGLAGLLEARIGVRYVSRSSPIIDVGTLWAAFVALETMPPDRIKSNWQGYEWIQVSDQDGVASLWLAKAVVP
jgi:hypothetical protein